MAANLNYVRKISGLIYKIKVNDITRPKDENKDLMEMVSDSRVLSKI